MLVDTHCHLDVNAFDEDRAHILQRCQTLGINKIVIPAIQRQSWDQLLTLCSADERLFPALGLHPMFMENHQPNHLDDLSHYLTQRSVVAIGEIGLDFYHGKPNRAQQQSYFEAQLQIAVEHQLPVILHVRKAHDETLRLLKQASLPGGIVHAYSGNEQQAKHYIDLGFKLGFGGMLTYERSRKLRTLATKLPLEAIVLETDAPDMVVAQHQGQRNSPEYLIHCLAALTEIRQQSTESIAQQTTLNAYHALPKLN